MRGIKEIKQDIEELKQLIRLSEISDDGYCLTPQCKENERTLFALKQELRQVTEKKYGTR